MEPYSSVSSTVGAATAEITLPRRYRAYRLRKALKTVGVIILGLIGLLFFSFLLLFR